MYDLGGARTPLLNDTEESQDVPTGQWEVVGEAGQRSGSQGTGVDDEAGGEGREG